MENGHVEAGPYGFNNEPSGLSWEHPKNGWMPVTATALSVNGIGSDVATGGAMRLVEVFDVDGNSREVALAASEIAGGGNAIRRLAEAGMVIVPGMEKKLLTYIQLYTPAERFDHTGASGWVGERNAFLVGQEVIGDDDGRRVIFNPKSPKLVRGFSMCGTLERWKHRVAMLAAGNFLLLSTLCVGFSGPLLRVLGFAGGGLHYHGRSSRGKTSILQFVASIWGDGTDPAVPTDTTLIRTWHSTGNALDALAEAHSDTLLALDELGKFSGKDLDHTIYALCGGQGKQALTSQRQLRSAGTWHSNIISNGEISVAQRIEQSGKRVMTGHMVRLIDIAVAEPFTNTHGMTAGDFANHLKQAVREEFGTAGPEFVRRLVAELAENPGLVEEYREHIEIVADELRFDGIEPEQMRILRRFALYQLAGQLACGWGILPFDEEGEAVSAAIRNLRDLWLAGNSEVSDMARAIQRLRSFIVRYHGGFVNIRNRNSSHGNARGYWNPTQKLYLFDDEQLQTASGGADHGEVAKELRDMGLLVSHEPKRLKVKQKLAWMDGRWERFYAVRANIVGGDEANDEANVAFESDDPADL